MFEDYSYEVRLAFCQAMANLVACDREVKAEERAELEALIAGTGLDLSDSAVAAVVDRELANPGSLKEILARVPHKELHAALFRMLIELACADAAIAPEERARILEAADSFGFNREAASELIDWTVDSVRLEKREHDILGRLLGS